MKRALLNLLLIGIVDISAARLRGAPPADELVAVASYRNSREVRETVGVRVGAILDAKKINWNGAGSAGMTVVVAASRGLEARELLAKAVKEEGLPLTLYGPKKGDRSVIVTPDSILERGKAK